MAVDAKHPAYIKALPDWELISDAKDGERTIKEAGTKYLPPTSGMEADGMTGVGVGLKAYNAYKRRARFPDVVEVSIQALIGIMHSKPPTIELPSVMEPLRLAATTEGEGLEPLLRHINEAQLTEGRIGLLVDVETGARIGRLPYIAVYNARSIINWDNGTRDGLVAQNLNFVALDESEDERDHNFEWEFEIKTRIAILGDVEANEGKNEGAVYSVGVFREANSAFSLGAMMVPSVGGRTLDEIPFTFINSDDIVPAPAKPPLLGLGNLAISIYRGEADYRQALFMQGQDTLVVLGGEEDTVYRTGAGASISPPIGGDAKYIGVDSNGLSEMRLSLENDRSAADQRSGQMLDTTSRAKESGDALRIRVGARTTTLNQIAMTGAFGLQNCLRQMAKWIGVNPDDVVVTPNLDFVDDRLDGRTLVEYMTAKSLGAPMSLESIHNIMEQKGLTDKTFAEELAAIEAEEPLVETDLGDMDDDTGGTDDTTT